MSFRALRRLSGLQIRQARHLLEANAPACSKTFEGISGLQQQERAPRLLWEKSWPLAEGWNRRSFQTSPVAGEEIKIEVPNMGDSISEGTIAGIERKAGDVVNEDDVLLQIETDKVTIDVRYTETKPGKIKEFLVSEDDTVTVGQQVCIIDKGNTEGADEGDAEVEDPGKPDEEKEKKPKKEEKPKQESKPEQKEKPPKKEDGKGSKADLKLDERPPREEEKPKQTTQKPPPGKDDKDAAIPSPKALRPERRVKMTRLRARVAERLKGAQNTYAMLTTFNEVDMTNLMQLRSVYKEKFIEKHGVKLGFMSAFVKASADALHLVPAVNATIDGDEIVYRDYTDVSIAVATPKGLVVPVLRSVDIMSFADVEKNINALGKKARDGTIGIDDMAGGTFTISNGGVYGSLLSTPIINPPQSAILGMHSINQRPLVIGKDILPRPVMNVALTYDHRLIDGREAVTFLKRIKDIIEDPVRLLLDC